MKRALIIGCAANVWKDVEAAREIGEYDATYCVKMAGISWPGGRFIWVGLHPEWIEKYRQERAKLGLHSDYETVAPLSGEVGMHGKHAVDRRVTYRWKGMNSSASSGIYGAKVALDDGYERVVLAGIPMETDAGHFERGKPWLQRDSFMAGFELALPHLMGKVKSMSGLTRNKLGLPTAEWLNS